MATEEVNNEVNDEICLTVSNSLHFSGVCQTLLKCHRSKAHVMECIKRHLFDERMLSTGSRIEGIATQSSDADNMMIERDISVFRSEVDSSNVRGYAFLMETTDVRPGFAKLRLLSYGNKDNDAHPVTVKKVKYCLVENHEHTGNSLYLSSARYGMFQTQMMTGTDKYSSLENISTHVYSHGPCATTVYNLPPEVGKPFEADLAIAAECVEWPLDAEEWFTRKRTKGWPNSEFVEQAKQMSCYVLPIGDPYSKTNDLEWRFAFVSAERELLWTFNDCQIQCCMILKLIKTQYLQPISDDLSSFHIKTILFWLGEENGIEMWTVSNLIFCVVSCLKSLTQCVKTLNLSHYFLRKRNLMFGKFEDEKAKKELIAMLNKVTKEPVKYVTDCVKSYVNVWQNTHSNIQRLSKLRNETAEEEDGTILHECEKLLELIESFEVTVHASYLPTTNTKLLKCLRYLHDLKDMNQEVVITAKAFCEARLSLMNLAHEMLYSQPISKESIQTNTLLRGSLQFLMHGSTIDGFTGHMYGATFFLKLGILDKAYTILQTLYQQNVIYYIGNHGNMGFIDKTTAEFLENPPTEYVIDRNSVTYDMVFVRTDKNSVPHGMVYECSMLGGRNNWNFLVMHPVVYAKYLYFEIALEKNDIKLRNESLTHLFKAIQNIKKYKHVEGINMLDIHRALNILGYCIRRAGHLEKAMGYFCMSLKLMPNGNAAAYHIAIILQKRLSLKAT